MLALERAYRLRLGIPESSELLPNLATLQSLVERHLESIPFENISLHMTGERETPIPLDRPSLVHKILTKHRGGCCLELNGLFSLLLQDLGFPVVQLVPCFVAAGPERGHKSSKKFRTIASHFILMVGLQRQDTPEYYMVDVGLGEPPLGPWPYHEAMINRSYSTPDGMEIRIVWDRLWVDGSGHQKQCIILEWKQTEMNGQEVTTWWEPRLQWDIIDAPVLLDAQQQLLSASPRYTLQSFSYVIDLLRQPKSSFARKMIICTVSRDTKLSISGRRMKRTSPRFGISSESNIVDLPTDDALALALETHFGIKLLPHERLDLRKSDSECKSRLWDHL